MRGVSISLFIVVLALAPVTTTRAGDGAMGLGWGPVRVDEDDARPFTTFGFDIHLQRALGAGLGLQLELGYWSYSEQSVGSILVADDTETLEHREDRNRDLHVGVNLVYAPRFLQRDPMSIFMGAGPGLHLMRDTVDSSLYGTLTDNDTGPGFVGTSPISAASF